MWDVDHSPKYAKNPSVNKQITRKLLALATVALLPLGVGCSKEDKPAKEPAKSAYKKIEKDFDKTEPPKAERKPVQGVDVSALEKGAAVRFESLVDILPSPCGKAHSLRTSRNTDTSCARAPFAVEYVYELLKDSAPDDAVKELYGMRYADPKPIVLKTDDKAPHSGPVDASVKIVEFYDYACPHCARFVPVIEEALTGLESKVVVYYKMFPLGHNEDSPAAGASAIAAYKQGKFKEMHHMLFKNMGSHKSANLKSYAKELGLDMAKWNSDFKAAKTLVDTDKAEGISAGLTGTPAIYINGQLYEGLPDAKYFKMFVKEALAQAQ